MKITEPPTREVEPSAQEVEHPTREIAIKKAYVDVKIIPLIDWFNSFFSVMTQYCCQGTPQNKPDPDSTGSAYVSFVCDHSTDLAEILSQISEYNSFRYQYLDEDYAECEETFELLKMEVSYGCVHDPIRYILRGSYQEMQGFIRFVTGENYAKT